MVNSGAVSTAQALKVAASGDVVNQGGTVTVSAGRDIATAGAAISSGGAVELKAGRDVLLGSASVTDSFHNEFKGGAYSGQTTRNLGSSVSAGSDLGITAGGDIALAGSRAAAGHDATITAGGNVLVSSVEDSTSYQAHSSSKGGFLGGGRSSEERSSSTTTIGSAVTAGNDVAVTAQGGDLAVQASKVAAEAGSATLTASGSVLVTAGADSASSYHKDERSGFLRSGLDKQEDATTRTVGSEITTRTVGSEITAGTGVALHAEGGDVVVQAATVRAGEQIALAADDGQVRLLTAKDSAYHAETHNSSNAVWQTAEDKGQVDETTRYASLQAGDGITVTAAKGVVAEIHTGNAPLHSTVAALAAKPETAWMAEMAKRDDLRWAVVQEAHDSWDYKSQGLSGPGAAIVSIAVMVATQGRDMGKAPQRKRRSHPLIE